MLEHYQWLASPEGTGFIAQTVEQSQSGKSLNQQVAGLRKRLSPERVGLILDMVELRSRATQKFSRADQLFFTRTGYEQSSSEAIARYKSKRFEPGAPLFDFCCGIGGDAIGLAARGPVVGWDRDACMGWIAEQNLSIYEADSFEAKCESVDEATIEPAIAWHLDPDRRSETVNSRTTSVEAFSPSGDVIDRMLGREPSGAIKLAPATEAPDHWLDRCELEWIGEGRECKQQVAWFGDLTSSPGLKSASVILDRAGTAETLVETPDAEFSLEPAAELANFLYESHPVVRAARIQASLCARFDLQPIAFGHGLMTSNQEIRSPLMQGFKILDFCPLERKAIDKLLLAHHAGHVEVKCHGLMDKRWNSYRPKAKGNDRLTLFLTRRQQSHLAIVAQRFSVSEPSRPGE